MLIVLPATGVSLSCCTSAAVGGGIGGGMPVPVFCAVLALVVLLIVLWLGSLATDLRLGWSPMTDLRRSRSAIGMLPRRWLPANGMADGFSPGSRRRSGVARVDVPVLSSLSLPLDEEEDEENGF